MGANQSNGRDVSPGRGMAVAHNLASQDMGRSSSGNGHRHKMVDKHKKNKAKPSPPQKPNVTGITHNSISLSWLPPRHVEGNSIIAYTVEFCALTSGGDIQWKVVTNSCQGTNYEVRHLENNASYMFRVRAENLSSVGKPSAPSDVITTKMYDTCISDRLNGHAASNDSSLSERLSPTSVQNFKRRHSFNVHLDGGLTSILNHSDIVPKSPATASYSTSMVNYSKTEKSQAILRNSILRTSLQPGRKVSVPILLPGTGTNSLNRLRESRNSGRTSISDLKVNGMARESRRTGLHGFRNSLCSSTSDLNSSENSGEASKKSNRNSRSSLGSSKSDMNISANSCEDSKTTNGVSRSSLLSSCSDVAVSNSRDGCSMNGSRNSLCDSIVNSDNKSGARRINDSIYYGNGNSMETSNNINSNESVSSCLLYTQESKEDDVDALYTLKEELKNVDLSEDKLKFCDFGGVQLSKFSRTDSPKGYYARLENPWERDTSVDKVSERIMAAPFCDDIKMALYTRDECSFAGHGCPLTNHCPEQGDFRTLRSVLQSSNMIVKTPRSLPDFVGVVMSDGGDLRTLTRGKLTTIADADEKEDTVRVTSL